MHVLSMILLLIGGIGLVILGIWLTLKELETWSKRHNDKWTVGRINGLGVGCIVIGAILIINAFN